MKSKIKFKVGTFEHNIEPHMFSGGELNVNIPRNYVFHNKIELIANIADSDGIMALAMVRDAISQLSSIEVHLYLGYVPYARQDRVCNPGEALSIKVLCNMINTMNFDLVTILDPHSDVTPALLDRVRVITPEQILEKTFAVGVNTVLVAPDAGATKKVEKVAQFFGGMEVIQGFKKRDLKTGALSGFGYIGDVDGKHLLIVDDICDGGGTFLGLANKLSDGGAKSVSLYVSHGIFSKGIDILLDGGISYVYTTDSFEHGCENSRLETINWI